jgi:tetratricopeptide (TPR) repeat protein
VSGIFEKLFAKDYTKIINAFLEKAKNITSRKELISLYDTLPENVKDYPQLIDYFTGLLLKIGGYLDVIRYTDKVLVEYEHLASSTYQRRGAAFQNLGQLTLAEKDYKTAIKLSEYDPVPYALLTDLYVILRRYKDALESAKLYIKYTRHNDYPRTLQTISGIREKLKFKTK